MHVLSRSLRCIESVLLCMLVMLALAAAAAGASRPSNRAVNAGPPDADAARAAVAELERDLDHELGRNISRAMAQTSAAAEPDDALSDAKQFYRRLITQPLAVLRWSRQRDSSPRSASWRIGTQNDKAGIASVILSAVPMRRDGAKNPIPASAQPIRASRLVLDRALAYRGTPYQWGGVSREGLDCSGLVLRVLSEFGLRVPHSAALLFGLGQPVENDELLPGDLVFFRDTYKPGISHVGIFDEGSQFVHASNAAGQVALGDMNRSYFRNRYAGARRLLPADASGAPRQSLTLAGKVVTAPLRLSSLRSPLPRSISGFSARACFEAPSSGTLRGVHPERSRRRRIPPCPGKPLGTGERGKWDASLRSASHHTPWGLLALP
jgi:cell wall-associated NlpC family hydrolase